MKYNGSLGLIVDFVDFAWKKKKLHEKIVFVGFGKDHERKFEKKIEIGKLV